MGLRVRKSINLGGGFRVNLSQSGVGYSWGVKGFRVTQTAKGTTRRTASIPGTGISWVEETGKRRNNSNSGNQNRQYEQVLDSNHYDTEEIVNEVASSMVSEGLEEMLVAANKVLKLNNLTTIGALLSLILSIFYGSSLMSLFFIFIVGKIYIKSKGLINLDYTIDDDQKEMVNERINPMVNITKCKKVWRIVQSSKVIDKKYSSGASNTVDRKSCIASTKAPFPFKANIQVASFQLGRETLLFLPDKLFVIQGSKIGALNYSDIASNTSYTKFVESESVPKDAQIVDYTWKYVNKSGGPDKRFKDNRQLPICVYGEKVLRSDAGLNTVIMFSNAEYV